MYKLRVVKWLYTQENKCIQLVPIAALGFIVFLSASLYVVDNNCSHCKNNLVFGPFAFGLSLSESNSSTIILDPNITAQVYFKGLNFPSSMAFLGPDDLLVLEKNEGTVNRIVNGTMLPDPLLKVNVSSTGERGMLGIAVAKPKSAGSKPTYVFLYFTESLKKIGFGNENSDVPGYAINRVYRYQMIDNKLVNPKLIFELPRIGSTVHNGGSMAIGPDNNVYIVIGDMSGSDPQKDELPNGRAGILRFTQDGNTVAKNGHTLLGKTNPLDKYYAYGMRNSFGIGFDPVTGILWDTENGPTYGDEINLVEPGFNSGWASIQGLSNQNQSHAGVIIRNNHIIFDHNDTSTLNTSYVPSFPVKLNYSSPKLTTTAPVGFTALTFLNSTNYGLKYKNDLFVGDFHNGNLYHFDLNTNRSDLDLTGQLKDRVANNISELKDVIFGQGFGGITDVDVGPDGNIYVLAVYPGGGNCTSGRDTGCIQYSSPLIGTIFKIVSSKNE